MGKEEVRKIGNIEKLVEVIATNVLSLTDKVGNLEKEISEVKEKMVTKDELEAFKLETNINFNNIETELKSFKINTNESIKKVEANVADLLDTDVLYDKRIEKLEDKFT